MRSRRKKRQREEDAEVEIDAEVKTGEQVETGSGREGVQVEGDRRVPKINVVLDAPKPSPPVWYQLEPMDVAAAQRTRVYRRKGFLSEAAIQRIVQRIRSLDLQPYTNSAVDIVGNRAVHCTSYLHTRDAFARHFPKLRSRVIALAAEANREEQWGWDEIEKSVAVRCAEYHEMDVRGTLPEFKHYDLGSIVTVDIMLEPSPRGGCFQTLEANGKLLTHEFRAGDALVFVAHKYHRVSPVKRGHRRVLVMELWNGIERTCGHRCERPWEDCDFSEP
ncbi:hypothetical protein CYMTET_4359 [Cymbomonas tetramitiformis]|uniref:Uncharacterized protein n=1 Tax=Cymbomonas tetramitiformis TaxID=36881 RepID=A0AAE0H1D0_9CHLO|nr:hypothetical protein CYMTET_4359 [Cymbomonas tetramitiformis]